MKILKNIFRILLLCLVVIVAYMVYDGYSLYKDAIDSMPLSEKIAEIKSIDNYTKIEEVPSIYFDAVIAAEDHRFYNHNGIDIISIVRAIVTDIKAMSFVEGGSTITQQLAKNIYFTQEKTISRKIAEVFMALDIERNYEKKEILEFYINTSFYGEGCYTVKEAARKYFDKEAIEMSDYECILLAGVPNAPSVYAPTINPDLAKKRQLQVIQKMIKYEKITEERAKEILEEEND